MKTTETYNELENKLEGPPSHLRELLSQRELTILPDVASKALIVADDPECCAEQLASLLEQDIELTADILRVANSVGFVGLASVVCLKDAVVRVGLTRCRDLILASCTASLMKRIPLEQLWVRDTLCQHGYATGVCCRLLNERLKLGLHGEEFTAGLIHDIGRLLLASLLPTQFNEGDSMKFDESDSDIARERSVFETDHCELGSWFAQQGGLPDVLVDIIKHHHCPERAGANQRMVALVHVADQMANHLQHCASAEGFDPRCCDAALEILMERSGVLSTSDVDLEGLLETAWQQLCESGDFA